LWNQQESQEAFATGWSLIQKSTTECVCDAAKVQSGPAGPWMIMMVVVMIIINS
jgi:hypothetical protein